MPMMMPQILRSDDFRRSQKPRYLENETSFSLQIKNSLITHQGLLNIAKNSFVAEVTLNYSEIIDMCNPKIIEHNKEL